MFYLVFGGKRFVRVCVISSDLKGYSSITFMSLNFIRLHPQFRLRFILCVFNITALDLVKISPVNLKEIVERKKKIKNRI